MRAEISEKVIQLFVDIIGFIDRSQVTEQTDFIHDFKQIVDLIVERSSLQCGH
ncbi:MULTISPECIES: hypothetical protein [unclassified Pseudomonas]|uniref:hypothetical protein n=1 Tax=unclassified Pseudomonas TaxID=196821 RepID=UPI00216A8210|nr:hypothetical protein [Pseudomonas sp. BIGb0381]MCS4314858.1 acyl carrier protein [Pseudomonas sp. BIGb0381]